ncbi:PREDICTED: uncharacterized protein LOC109591648 [Amphimedon queenslandica]|uniref:Uncharacterized protein n=1 Tax=Amphimedon queenslandica TaxID=400682 RepID=A0A1X7SSQ6_AMPQE|nr:PREDICTED: uncharacterized protein LOC109591648 [Amphimedon queenslandica]|eukprot:XP_019862896.1 PREDICTED: uncharacterized protein LOC109591648 [Amphimedon queenslandica]
MNLFGSELVEYLVLSNPLNDSNSAVVRVRLPPTANSYDLTDLNVPNGFHYIWVQAVSKIGEGEFSTSVLYNRSNSFMNPTLPTVNNEPLILSVSLGALALIVFIVLVNALLWIVLVIKKKRKQKRKKEQSGYIDSTLNPSYQMTTARSPPTTMTSPISQGNVAYNEIAEVPHLNRLNPNEKFYEEIDDIAVDTAGTATAPSATPTYLEVF